MTKVKKIKGRKYTSIGNLNVRTVRPAGKLEELTHKEINRYHVNILGLCEIRKKNFDKVTIYDRQKVELKLRQVEAPPPFPKANWPS